MPRLKLPPWLTLLYTIKRLPQKQRYFQAILKHVNLASSYVHRQLMYLELHRVIKRIRNIKNLKIKDIVFMPKAMAYMNIMEHARRYYQKNKKGEYELKDFKDVK